MVLFNAARKRATVESLPNTIPQIFNDAQKPNANHRKHAIALRKIQEQCGLNSPIVEGQPQDIDEENEAKFNRAVIKCVNRILRIRKREPHADRIVRFIASFMQYTQQLDTKEVADDEELVDEEPEDTLSSRFVEYLMRHLLRGMTAKHKPVRLRCCQIIALSINSLGEIDEALYQDLKRALFERIKDKEPSVRIQAATALSRLQTADDEVDESDERTITQKLLHLLQHDPSAEVRRVVLFNLDKTQETMPYIVQRARDVDAINRRVVFLKPMAEIENFQLLPLKERHELLKWGLNDRDELVKRAATKMLATQWIRHADHNLLEFLERIDVIEGEAADDALTAFLNARTDIVNSIKFDEQYWENLSPESAFMAKVYIKFLKTKGLDEKLDAVLPEVTRHAFCIQRYNSLWQEAPKETEDDYEFIVGQLLDIAKCLDYADEVGRRKMFVLLRELLMAPDIPDDHIASAVEIFKIISLNEPDFTRTMIEIISDIQEELVNDDFEQADTDTPAKRQKREDSVVVKQENEKETGKDNSKLLQKMLTQLKCLTICKFMLERTEESLQNNSTLYGLLNELIVPSVQSKEVVLREEGLHCLGLCCLLDKTLGLHNIPLFAHCLRNGHEELQQKALMILFDLIMAYGYSAVENKFSDPEEFRDLFEFALDHDSIALQTIAVEGLAKIMLSRMFNNEDTLRLLILRYFFPATGDNSKVQQCLSYFFPVYCYSSPENQKTMAKVAVPALQELCETYMDLDPDEEMVSPAQIADMLADWTDPRKLVQQNVEDGTVDQGIQADMAIEMLKAIYRQTGIIRKTMVHMLLRIHIAEAGNERLEEIQKLIDRIEEEKPIQEAMVRNSFRRFTKSVRDLKKDTANADANTEAKTDTNADTNTNANADTNTDANMDADADTNADTDADSDADADINAKDDD